MHGNVPCVLKEQHLFENHAQDARYKGPLEVSPMLPAQLGTGGNNQPLVVESHPVKCYDIGEARLRTPSEYEEVCPTLTARCGTGGNNVPAVVKGDPVYCLQGNGIDRADTAGCNGKGWKKDTAYTLNTIDRPAVAYEAVSLLGDKVAGTLMARDYKGIGRHDTLGSAVCIPTDVRYIVRRLTPTECARLQGFPDTWGHPDVKDNLSDEEYQFWLNVRNTHAAINGKATKEYTTDQILKWYNGLHTDSSEYKMWGNGIALPNALYMMQGIAEVMSEEKAARRKWLKDLLGDCL
jgi:DNA (cytosine-5)-methyltransferase 1